MKRFAFALAAIILSCSSTAFSRHICGTSQLIQHLRENKSSIRQLVNARPSARTYTSKNTCTDSDLYDSVYTRTTDHFEIFYTFKGPHQTTPEFVDSLEKTLEYAWNFHVQKTGMRTPIGPSQTYHYQKEVKGGLYPVEVIDIDLLRDSRSILGTICHGCFGLTLPFDSTQSELIIDNDFRYTPNRQAKKDSVKFNEKTCTYAIATEELHNQEHDYSYAQNWMQGLRVTTAHELYHAIQLRYLDMLSYMNFWFEASASGIEEVVVPDIDDYFAYLPSIADAVGTPLNNLPQDYGAAVFFLYLYNHVGHNSDKLIWESFAQDPAKSFQHQLTQVASKRNLSADSLFHDFAIRLSFAGNRSALADSSFWISSDQSRWPDFLTLEQAGRFEADPLEELAYRFYKNGAPEASKFTGKASAITIKNNVYRIHFLPTTNSIDSIYNLKADSTLWVFSRFTETELVPTVFKDSTLKAYPTPWRHGNLCFTPLPPNKDFIEIRNRRGNLVQKIKYETATLCLDESRVKELMSPGVYRFRIGNSGKTKDFIVVY